MRSIVLAAAVLLGAAVVASAATVRYRTDAELVAISDRVVRGRVLDSVVERAPSGVIRTRTRVAVIEDFTGGTDTILTVLELGGRLPDGSGLWIPGAPRFAPGDDVVLCLERTAGGFRTVSMAFSAFRVGAAAAGDRPLTRFDGTAVVGGRAVAGAVAGVEAARGLEGFRRAARSVRGAAARTVLTEDQAAAAVAAATTSARVDAPFTLLGGGVRWQQADSGQAITWYRNTLRPSPIQGADTDDQIRTALAAWTDPPTASITLAFGGTREVAIEPPASPAEDPYCTAGNLGVGLITFGDPLDELPFGVLAIGGGCTSPTTHSVNGTTFNALTHGLVVLNDDASLEGYRTAPNITRILEHEVGHGIGLGHTDQGTDNIMYPACCPPEMPLPPAIGPDDLAGLVFIYPPCVYSLSQAGSSPATGEQDSLTLTVSMPSCPWTVDTDAIWLSVVSPRSGTGNALVHYRVAPNLATPVPRSASLSAGPVMATIEQQADAPLGNGLFAGWTQFFGLHPESGLPEDGPAGDPDGDGVSNLDEQAAGTHPRGTVRRYLAEGAANAFFDTEVALFNPGAVGLVASVVLRVQPETGPEASWPVALYGGGRATVEGDVFRSLTRASFSTLIESDRPVVVDRTMRWDATGYGAHAETSVEAPAPTWYLAEGSTSGEFSLFYLLQNPGAAAVLATIRYLRPAPMPPVERQYAIAPHARLTVPVDTAAPELANTDVSGVITATQPIVVERAMYLNRPGQPFAAGHESAGVTAPATEWFLAEGATGSFFDLFLLIANPGLQPALVRVDYLLPGGGTLTKDYAVASESRFTIYVDDEQLPAGSGQRPLASTSVAMRVRSMNGTPILVERAMWWPQPDWYEAHNAPGTTATGTRWALAGGETGGPAGAETYILIANTGTADGTARLTVCAETGVQITRDVALPAGSRTSVAVSAVFPEFAGLRFATLVESIGATPAPIVVERAMYESPGGVTWAAGTDVVATRLTP